jgi:hypothetical protein
MAGMTNMMDAAGDLKSETQKPAEPTVTSIFDELNTQHRVGQNPVDNAYRQLCRQFDQVFAQVDQDKNGFISLAELNKSVESKKLAAHDVHMVMAIRTCFQQLSVLHPEGDGKQVSKSDLSSFVKLQRENHLFGAARNDLLDQFPQAARPATDSFGKRIPLFADVKHPHNSVTPDACAQFNRGGGNCILIASMQTLARGDKQAIINMIRDNGNDTYTVTFPGVPDKPITVSAPTDNDVVPTVAQTFGTWS